MTGLADRLRVCLEASSAEDSLRSYLGSYSGAWFERLREPGGSDASNWFTATDLVAMNTLDAGAPGGAVVHILGRDADELSALLANVPRDVDLHEVEEAAVAPDSPVQQLWRRLRAYDGMGPVRTSKLLARKRPRLVPIRDQFVMQALFSDPAIRPLAGPLRAALQQHQGVVARLESIRGSVPGAAHLSLLRVLDIVVWMRHRTEPVGGGRQASEGEDVEVGGF